MTALLSKNVILIAAAVAFAAFVFIYAGVQKQAIFDRGVDAGKGTASTAAVQAATETAAAEREAFDTTPLPASNAAILELCKRSASCRERGTLK